MEAGDGRRAQCVSTPRLFSQPPCSPLTCEFNVQRMVRRTRSTWRASGRLRSSKSSWTCLLVRGGRGGKTSRLPRVAPQFPRLRHNRRRVRPRSCLESMSLLPFGRRFAQLGPHTVYHAHTCIVPYPLLFQFHPFNLESGRLFAED